MNRIQIFNNQKFGAIRTMSDEHGEVMFCAKDVASELRYKKPENAIAVHVDNEDKTTTLIQGTGSNYKSQATFINESGLYALILSSKLDSAKRFKHWVTSEVLPAIRKQGGYMVVRPDESDEVIMARALEIMRPPSNDATNKSPVSNPVPTMPTVCWTPSPGSPSPKSARN